MNVIYSFTSRKWFTIEKKCNKRSTNIFIILFYEFFVRISSISFSFSSDSSRPNIPSFSVEKRWKHQIQFFFFIFTTFNRGKVSRTACRFRYPSIRFALFTWLVFHLCFQPEGTSALNHFTNACLVFASG